MREAGGRHGRATVWQKEEKEQEEEEKVGLGNQRDRAARRGERGRPPRGGYGGTGSAQHQFINRTTLIPTYGGRRPPRRGAISSFILINNACQESRWAVVAGSAPRHGLWKQFPAKGIRFLGVALFPPRSARLYPLEKSSPRA